MTWERRFYYLDLFIIVAAYVPCMCAVGWYVESSTEEGSWKLRLADTAFIALLEVLVAASTLVYCLFIMPLFFMITSAWLQVSKTSFDGWGFTSLSFAVVTLLPSLRSSGCACSTHSTLRSPRATSSARHSTETRSWAEATS